MVIEVVSCFVVQCGIKHDGVLGCVIWQRKSMESSLTKFASKVFKKYILLDILKQKKIFGNVSLGGFNKYKYVKMYDL